MSILLVLAMANSLFPISVLAAGTKAATVYSDQDPSNFYEYDILQEAINAAGDGDTIVLGANITESVAIGSEKNVSLDLSGHMITFSAATVITNKGTLHVTGTDTI